MARRKKNTFDLKSLVIGVIAGVILTQVFAFVTSKKMDQMFLPKLATTKESSLPAVKFKSVSSSTDQAVEKKTVTQQQQKKVVSTTKPSLGRMAIVIDDWGYTARNCHFMEEIDAPFAVAILPNLPFTTEIARCAQDNDKLVMLHLPMEPEHTPDEYPKDYLLKTSMGDAKIRTLLSKTFDRMPWIQGVNNHMGSKATADQRLMRVVLEELKNRDLFFLDSLVTSNTVSAKIALEKDVPYAKRDIFLDNENKRSSIENMFQEAADLAKKNGSVVLIGHDRPLTMQIIKEQTAMLQEQGFEFVNVTEMLR